MLRPPSLHFIIITFLHWTLVLRPYMQLDTPSVVANAVRMLISN